MRDYLTHVRTGCAGDQTTLHLPPSNVLAFELAGGSRIAARPSGTEPKIKFYFDLRVPVSDQESMQHAERRAQSKLDAIEQAFVALTL